MCVHLSSMSTIPLSCVCVQHVVDRRVCSVERYMYEQQSQHKCVCIPLLCLLYLCHLCVRSTMSTGATYISHVSYTSTHESCLLYIYILVMSLTRPQKHVVDRCVRSVERYMYVQQRKHMCVCISLLCLIYMCYIY